MKKFIFILTLLLPAVLFAQKDSGSKKKFRIGAEKLALVADGHYYTGNTPIKLSDLMKGAELKVLGYGDSTHVVSFVISFGINNVYKDSYVTGEIISRSILSELKDGFEVAQKQKQNFYVIIKKPVYRFNGKKTYRVKGLYLLVVR